MEPSSDISHRALAIWIVSSMVVTLAGFLYFFGGMVPLGITGLATGNDTEIGSANFSINRSIAIYFTTANIDFGSGRVNNSLGNVNCTLNTSVAGPWGVNCIGFNAPTISALRLQNQGTVNVSVTLNFTKAASGPDGFINGTGPYFGWRVSNNDTGSCSSLKINTAENSVVQNSNVSICNLTGFDYNIGRRTMNVDIGIKIPADAPTGARIVSIVAFASD